MSIATNTPQDGLREAESELDRLAEAWIAARVQGADTEPITDAIKTATRTYRKFERKLRKMGAFA